MQSQKEYYKEPRQLPGKASSSSLAAKYLLVETSNFREISGELTLRR
jgi:hypothetical protein